MMPRTRLCLMWAGGLALASLIVMATRSTGEDPFKYVSPQGRVAAEFLLLLPIAALVVCVFRNVIGLTAFGTFTPALLGMALYETGLALGLGLLGLIVIPGWWLRQGVEGLRLLQVPRAALLLSLIACLLLLALVWADSFGFQSTNAVSLMPLVILTGMVERLWTLEEEDGSGRAFRTLLGTTAIAIVIASVIGIPGVAGWMLAHPETLGVVMAAQIVLGRYTGFRLTELYRFRELTAGVAPPQPDSPFGGEPEATVRAPSRSAPRQTVY